MTPELIAALQKAKNQGRPVVLATKLPTGEQHLILDPSAPTDAPKEVFDAAQAALGDDESRTVDLPSGTWFLNIHNPPLRLIVVGAVHIAQALVPVAAQVGYAVTVVDPRRSFATDERFPNVTVSTDWPDEALDALRPDIRTAIVTLTHDPKLDDPALDRALKSPAFYVGALGSRRTHAARLGRLRELGHSDEAMARIRGPVGVDIAAVTQAEIAVSIMAEVIAAHRGAALGQKQPRNDPGKQAA